MSLSYISPISQTGSSFISPSCVSSVSPLVLSLSYQFESFFLSTSNQDYIGWTLGRLPSSTRDHEKGSEEARGERREKRAEGEDRNLDIEEDSTTTFSIKSNSSLCCEHLHQM